MLESDSVIDGDGPCVFVEVPIAAVVVEVDHEDVKVLHWMQLRWWWEDLWKGGSACGVNAGLGHVALDSIISQLAVAHCQCMCEPQPCAEEALANGL